MSNFVNLHNNSSIILDILFAIISNSMWVFADVQWDDIIIDTSCNSAQNICLFPNSLSSLLTNQLSVCGVIPSVCVCEVISRACK